MEEFSILFMTESKLVDSHLAQLSASLQALYQTQQQNKAVDLLVSLSPIACTIEIKIFHKLIGLTLMGFMGSFLIMTICDKSSYNPEKRKTITIFVCLQNQLS